MIPQSKKQFFQCLIGILLFFAFSIPSSHAMGQNIDEEVDEEFADTTPASPYRPSEWHTDANPEKDAGIALQNNDHRLLAFALRTANVPGIEPKLVESYRKKCGLRFMKDFGDVVRSDEDLKRMKQAHEYALHYNTIIASKCTLAE